MRLAEALTLARALGVARLDAQLLLAHRLRRDRAWLIAHDDERLDDAAVAGIRDDLERRAAGVPLAYLTGRREFHGLSLEVNANVLVPRPETEGLVDWAIERLVAMRERWPAPAVADLGTGSGAIALAIVHACPWATLTGTDASAAALRVASANATRLGLPLRLAEGSWFRPLAGARFALLVSNPPYVAGDDPHLVASRFEPRQALTPEGDGLAALRTITCGARQHLVPGGWLLVEHGYDQGDAVAGLLRNAGLVDVTTRADLAGLPRTCGGRAPD